MKFMPKKSKKLEQPLQPRSRQAVLLREIIEELDLLATFGYQPVAVLKYGMQGVRRMRLAKDRKWRLESMRRLIVKRLVDVRKIGDEYRIALTKKGAEAAFRFRIHDAELLPENVTCFVIFDIPETERAVRAVLRRFLAGIGFAQLQQSVWICRFDVAVPLLELLKLQNRRRWVRVFNAHEL